MDKTQKDAVKKYAKLAGLPRDKSLSSGRKDVDKGKDAHIWRDIESKLGFYENCEVLDLGCGFGGLIDYCIESSKKQSWKLTLFDIPEVIEALFQNQTEHDMFGINTYSGIYPYEVDDKLLEKMFDRILLYSVLHYTDNPKELLLKLAGQLRSGGRMLVGDLPKLAIIALSLVLLFIGITDIRKMSKSPEEDIDAKYLYIILNVCRLMTNTLI